VGNDSSYADTVAFCIDQSDGVTAVSQSLKKDTYRQLPVRSPIRVIPNFLDCETYRRQPDPGLRARFTGGDEGVKLVAHASNFRPVKRVGAVVDVFHRIRRELRAKLLLIGDGPDLEPVLRLAGALGVAGDVEAVGEQDRIVPLLSIADLFLLPSAQESFGLAALEAMACEVPVVASRVGGLPEVIEHGVSGFLHAADDLSAMAESGRALLSDPDLHRRVREAALETAHDRFGADRIIPMYEEFYREIAPTAE
jgi:L-malate glycosyltransferase